jgi:excisionase family DNA binding protein
MHFEDEYLSLAQFSTYSGLSQSTLRRRIRDGSLPAIQPGGPGTRLVIPRDALDRLRRQPPLLGGGSEGGPRAALPATSDQPRHLPGPRPSWIAAINTVN